eukprot:COSAG01_NODE_778_length_13681_cov_15.265130_14_plen_87_part_00
MEGNAHGEAAGRDRSGGAAFQFRAWLCRPGSAASLIQARACARRRRPAERGGPRREVIEAPRLRLPYILAPSRPGIEYYETMISTG